HLVRFVEVESEDPVVHALFHGDRVLGCCGDEVGGLDTGVAPPSRGHETDEDDQGYDQDGEFARGFLRWLRYLRHRFDALGLPTDRRGTAGGRVGAGIIRLLTVERTRGNGGGAHHRRVITVDLDDVGDYHGDIVRATGAQGQFHQAAGGVLRGAGAHGLLNGAVGDRIGQAIRAQQQAIAGQRRDVLQRGLDRVAWV